MIDIPVLYLSRFINKNKSDDYRLLQEIRISGDWNSWVIWILTGIHQTSQQTVYLIRRIKELMEQYQYKLQHKAPNIYSKELLEGMFKHPYTKIKFVEDDLDIHRQTASKYLENLVELELLIHHKIGKNKYYINHK